MNKTSKNIITAAAVGASTFLGMNAHADNPHFAYGNIVVLSQQPDANDAGTSIWVMYPPVIQNGTNVDNWQVNSIYVAESKDTPGAGFPQRVLGSVENSISQGGFHIAKLGFSNRSTSDTTWRYLTAINITVNGLNTATTNSIGILNATGNGGYPWIFLGTPAIDTNNVPPAYDANGIRAQQARTNTLSVGLETLDHKWEIPALTNTPSALTTNQFLGSVTSYNSLFMLPMTNTTPWQNYYRGVGGNLLNLHN